MNQLLLAICCLLALFPFAVHAGGAVSTLNSEPDELLHAIESQNIKSIKKIIQDSTFVPNSDALTAAIKVGSLKIVKLLIKAGADYQFTNRNGHGALALSIIYVKPRIAQYLLELGVDVNQKDRYGYTPLMTACEFDEIKIVEALLDGKADPNFHDNPEGASALHLAVALSRVEIAGLLIARGADINLKDREGRTPGQVSIKAGNSELFKLLGYFPDLLNSSISKEQEMSNGDNIFDFTLKSPKKPETHLNPELERESSILTEVLSTSRSPRYIPDKQNKKRVSIDESSTTQDDFTADMVSDAISNEGFSAERDFTDLASEASFIESNRDRSSPRYPKETHVNAVLRRVSIDGSSTPITQIDSGSLTNDALSTEGSSSSKNQMENSENSRHGRISSHGSTEGSFVNSIEESKVGGAIDSSSNIHHDSAVGQEAESEKKAARVSYVSSFSDRKKTNQTGTHLELMSKLYEQWDYAI